MRGGSIANNFERTSVSKITSDCFFFEKDFASFLLGIIAYDVLKVPTLMQLSRLEYSSVQSWATENLLSICTRERSAAIKAFPFLLNILHSKNSQMRCQALYALGKIGPLAKEAIPLLTKLLYDPDTQVRRLATETLQKIISE